MKKLFFLLLLVAFLAGFAVSVATSYSYEDVQQILETSGPGEPSPPPPPDSIKPPPPLLPGEITSLDNC